MASATSFELVAAAAWILAKITGFLLALVFLCIVVARLLYLRRVRHVRRLRDEWQNWLVDCLYERPERRQSLARGDVESFLMVWNHFHESIRDDSKENLNVLARLMKLDSWCLHALRKRNYRKKLLAIQSLGWMQERRAWNELERLVHSPSPTLSLAAVKALVRIDTESALEIFLPQVVKRGDWSYSIVGQILRTCHADLISEPLVKVCLEAPEKLAPRTIRFLGLAHTEVAAPAIRKIIARTSDREVLIKCLRVVRDPKDLETVRRLLKYDDWRVRSQAATCLGRYGTDEDEKRLRHAAGDQEWWVRYRSAQALANLPSMTFERLDEIAENHHNFFAQDIIKKISEERKALT